MGDIFRVFTHSVAPSTMTDEDLNILPYVTTPQPQEWEYDEIYTDGSCSGLGADAKAGSGVWYGPDFERNLAFRVPFHLPQTNNTAEACAILAAVQNADETQHIEIKSDSKVTIDALRKYARSIEDQDWAVTKNREILEPLIARVRKRAGSTQVTKVKAHIGIEGNEAADRLANVGANQSTETLNLDFSIPATVKVQGMRLSQATQALLYKGVRRRKLEDEVNERRITKMHLDLIRHEVKERVGFFPSDEDIWSSIKNKNIRSKRARQLLWKLVHRGLPIGTYWDNITNYEHRARCIHCGTTESPEHIFTECKFTGQALVWKTVGKLLENRNIPWSPPTLGTILGCAISDIRNETDAKPRPRANRLYTILLSEATHFIWKIRCEWKIQKEEALNDAHSANEILRRWIQSNPL
ncbi:hypothetical protein NMY22_g260 [Coprinellus aureogranulatus]|nr:hypothetical protein NMY22_g260 [Coprinellus aureogranulatus]